MDPIDGLGALALVPASTAIVLAFLTRNTLFALTVACLAGVLVAGLGPAGFPKLLVTALGNEGFAWVMLLEFFIGMFIAFFQRTGAIENFSAFISRQAMTRRRVQLMTWLMGTFVYFSDYFSPSSLAAPCASCRISTASVGKSWPIFVIPRQPR